MPRTEMVPLSPYWVLGGLFVLLILAVGLRVMRARARRPPR